MYLLFCSFPSLISKGFIPLLEDYRHVVFHASISICSACLVISIQVESLSYVLWAKHGFCGFWQYDALFIYWWLSPSKKVNRGYVQVLTVAHTYIWPFPEMGVPPVIIHLNWIIHYKPSLLGYPHFRKLPYIYIWIYIYNMPWVLSPIFAEKFCIIFTTLLTVRAISTYHIMHKNHHLRVLYTKQ